MDDRLVVALFVLALSALIGLAANGRGRSGFGWFLLCLLISPVLAFVVLLIVGPLNKNAASVTEPTPTNIEDQ